MSIVTSKVSSKVIKGLQVENVARNFSLRIDEPEQLGGSNSGMTPMEAMLIALGSCQVIVASSFAQYHDIDLQEFRIEVEGDMDMDGFQKGKPGVRMGFQEVRLTPHIKSNSSPEAIKEFIKFVESRCPVTDVMMSGTKIVSQKAVVE
jgi:uncharacterized OsmC-like protein